MDSLKSKRKKIPAEIEAEVIFLSDRLGCIDQKRGDHIHHIDGDSSNYNLDNLAFLCFDCHNEASLKGSLRKKLTAKTIIRYRSYHYDVVKTKRQASLQKLNSPIKNLTSEDLIKATTTALMLIEFSKIKEEYYKCVLLDRNDIIEKIFNLSEHSNARIAFEIFSFLTRVAYETRSGIPTKMAQTIYTIAIEFFPPPELTKGDKQLIEIGQQCISVASTLFYDSTIHFKNFKISCWGLLLLKYVFIQSTKLKENNLISSVYDAYDELERQLTRPERNDLSDAKKLLNLFLTDLKSSSLSFPPHIPEDLLV